MVGFTNTSNTKGNKMSSLTDADLSLYGIRFI
jgi:hypothetical protein